MALEAVPTMALSAMHLSLPSNCVHDRAVDEFTELEKIVKLRDAVYADKHPRFKPPYSTNPTFSQRAPSSNSSPSIAVTENTRPLILSSPHVPRPITTSGKPGSVRTQSLADPQINNVLLAKSDVLIKAENNLKRDRIERELKHQLESKIREDRLGKDEGVSRDPQDDELDVGSIIARAQSLVNNIVTHVVSSTHELSTAPGRPSRQRRSLDDINPDVPTVDELQYEDPSPINLDKEPKTGEHSPVQHDLMEIDDSGLLAQPKSLGDTSVIAENGKIGENRERVLNILPGLASTLNAPVNQRPTPQDHAPQEARADINRSRPAAPIGREIDAPSPLHHTGIRERATPRSPMQSPRYSTSRTPVAPVAPQPVRAAADVTRLAAQDLIIDLRDDEVEERPREPAHQESRRSPYIKPEPGTRPPSVFARRSASPATRVEGYSTRRPYYNYPEPLRYPYAHPIPAGHVLPAYDPYYRLPYAYPPPPPSEFSTRSFGGVYTSPRYPSYDDYGRLYHHPAAHVVPMHPPRLPALSHIRSPEPLRHSSRAPDRRPASPEIHRRRHSSRSLSPGRILEVAPIMRPVVERAGSRTPSVAPISHRDYYERHVHPAHSVPAHYIDPYHPGYYTPYSISERPIYYDEGRYYAAPRPLPPSPHYITELHPPPLPREYRDGSVAPRGVVSANYRDRDYFYCPPSPMAPPPRPRATVDYREYRELPRDAQDGRSRSVRPEAIRVREEEFLRPVSVRPEVSDRFPGYALPLPQGYAPPPPALFRAMSARPEPARELYRLEERAYIRGASDDLARREQDHPRERALGREVEESRRYRDVEEQRRYRGVEEHRRFSRSEEPGRAAATY